MQDGKWSKLLDADEKKKVKDMGEKARCDKFNKADYEHYISGEMSLQEMESFADHCENCRVCLLNLKEYHDKSVNEREMFENNLLYDRTLQFMDAVEEKENILDVVIKTFQNALEIIFNTGETLQPFQPLPVRGSVDYDEGSEPLQIVKEFSDPPLSVQLTLSRKKSSGINLNISLLDPVSDDFCSEIPVRITGPGINTESMTDEYGEITCDLQEKGKYFVMIGKSDRPERRITITLLE